MAKMRAESAEAPAAIFAEHEKMATRIARLFNQPELADLYISVGKCDVCTYYAHKCIVLGGFGYLAAEAAKSTKIVDGRLVIRLPNMNTEHFDYIIRFLYTGSAVIKIEDAIDTFRLASQLDVEGLKQASQRCMSEGINVDQVVPLLRSCQERGMTQMVESCVAFICRYATKVFRGEDFVKIDYPTLREILSRDQLSLSYELHAFKAVLKWQEVNNAPQSDFKELVSLIRFGLIEIDDLQKHVYPTGLLDKDLLVDCVLYQQLHRRKTFPANPIYITRRKPAPAVPGVGGKSAVVDAGDCLHVFHKMAKLPSLTFKKGDTQIVGNNVGSWLVGTYINQPMTSGIWYCEIDVVGATQNICFGIAEMAAIKGAGRQAVCHLAGGYMYWPSGAGSGWTGNQSFVLQPKTSGYKPPKRQPKGVAIGCLVDFDRRMIEFYQNRTSLGCPFQQGVFKKGKKHFFTVDIFGVFTVTLLGLTQLTEDDLPKYSKWIGGSDSADDESSAGEEDSAGDSVLY
eukprot:TRINITY_DN11390_c0_g1_i1.p1 TRINITY_DN11390_c0_g1~~TRINITY_DN11390_c0_g1_i1.p1  ORF type:complete len:522 (+),score=82.71 TRINITY_DN11390_c0_g1_i1:33-1568(+)